MTEYVLKFIVPDKKSKGFLKRMRTALELYQQWQDRDNLRPELVDEMVEFLLPHVTEPADREEARSALWDCSEEEFQTFLEAVVGKQAEPSPPRGGGSETST